MFKLSVSHVTRPFRAAALGEEFYSIRVIDVYVQRTSEVFLVIDLCSLPDQRDIYKGADLFNILSSVVIDIQCLILDAKCADLWQRL